MYIDESGDTIPLTQKGKKFLVLTGCILQENDVINIEKQFRLIKQKYYHDSDIEIKSNFLRYANPDLAFNSPIKLHDREKYNQLESDVTKLKKFYSFNGKVEGIGLKFFPDISKKDLRFFEDPLSMGAELPRPQS